MSHKIGKRSKKSAEEEGEFKTPDNSKSKDEVVKGGKGKSDSSKKDEGGETKKDADQHNGESGDTSKRSKRTRSRSNTPSSKNNDSTNGVKDEDERTEDKVEEKNDDTIEVAAVKESEIKLKEVIVNIQTLDTEKLDAKISRSSSPATSIEMDPLILEKEDEEPIPELQFDENDIEVESEGSNSRCKTRRSHSRNVSTPKTPKLADQETEELEIVDLCESRGGSVTPKKMVSLNDPNVININLLPTSTEESVDLNDTSDTFSSVSTDNLSTKAVAGNDATRNCDFIGQDLSFFDGNSTSKSHFSNRSYSDTVKSLSGRRGIHSANRDDFRKYVLKNSIDGKGEAYADYESVRKITSGVKRKSRSFSPTRTKRIKSDSPGFLSYLSSPITNFRHTFNRKHSTPQLLMMDKCEFDTDGDFDKIKLENGIGDENKKWCSIM